MIRKRIAILFGGKSEEHEISILSAKAVYSNIDRSLFEPILVKILRNGEWYRCTGKFFDIESDQKGLRQIAEALEGVDLVFPLIHGAYGEDGRIQGFLEVLGINYVGSRLTGSSICMDKAIAKSLLRDAGIRVADFILFEGQDLLDIERKIGYPCYVKPSNGGSSLGVSKVSNRSDLQAAIEYAKSFDCKVLIEKYIKGRELECALLSDENIKVSDPGEIIAQEGYTYEEKYSNTSTAKIIVKANLEESIKGEIKQIAVDTFKILQCIQMARVDFFLTESKEIFVNEVNTMPGFTQISLFPRMCEGMGIKYMELITILIHRALYQKCLV